MKPKMNTIDHINQIIAMTKGTQKEYYKFILKHGKYYTKQTLEVKEGLVDIELKKCYKNALLCAIIYDTVYVEGFYITEGIDFPFQHAFNDINGRYFDATTDKFKIPVIERFGVPIPYQVVMDYILEDDAMQERFTPLEYYYITKFEN